MRWRAGSVLVLLGGLLAVVWLLVWLPRSPPAEPPGDRADGRPTAPVRREASPETAADPAAQEPPSPAERVAPPGTPEATRGPGGSPDARGTTLQTPPTPGRASVAGTAWVPEGLVARRSDMRLYVVRRFAVDDGYGEESWIVPAPFDAEGRYAMRNLPSGSYVLCVTCDGEPVSEARRVSLGTDEASTDVDFFFEPQPDLAGTVVSALDARPLVGARVRLGAAPPVVTDTEGRFVLEAVEPGANVLLVAHPDAAPLRMVVDVSTGRPAPDLDLQLEPGAEVTVLVRGADGAARAGVFVTLSEEDHLEGARTGTDGVARFRGLAPGWTYRARTPEHPLRGEPPTIVPEAGRVLDLTMTLAD